MIILRKTMDAAVEAERARYSELASRFGEALDNTAALQRQIADWITEKGDTLTPEQAAALFWHHDNRWQAEFFNSLQKVATDSWEARSEKDRMFSYLCVPAGEGQWCWMADHINESGFETLEAMFEHAKHAREKVTA